MGEVLQAEKGQRVNVRFVSLEREVNLPQATALKTNWLERTFRSLCVCVWGCGGGVKQQKGGREGSVKLSGLKTPPTPTYTFNRSTTSRSGVRVRFMSAKGLKRPEQMHKKNANVAALSRQRCFRRTTSLSIRGGSANSARLKSKTMFKEGQTSKQAGREEEDRLSAAVEETEHRRNSPSAELRLQV